MTMVIHVSCTNKSHLGRGDEKTILSSDSRKSCSLSKGNLYLSSVLVSKKVFTYEILERQNNRSKKHLLAFYKYDTVCSSRGG